MNYERDPASRQLEEYAKSVKNEPDIITTSSGVPLDYITASQTVGPMGPILLQDIGLLDTLSHLVREKIPERQVHAKAAGAFGILEVTHDITKYTAAKIFSTVGKKTAMATRFSIVNGSSGSADTVRDIRGFALKFYTEEGIWDLVGNNTPIFFVRDPTLFPLFNHSHKKNPVTNLMDWDAYWDFMSLRPETIHQFILLYSDRGIPDGYRFQNGFGSHTFTLINKDGNTTYCKFHFKPKQGIKNLSPKEAMRLAGTDPDYAVRDLYNAIARGDFPCWHMYIQVMTPEDAAAAKMNPFDLTKVWPQKSYPLIPVGMFTLKRNPSNFFAEIEQLAFCPANMVPGIGPSPDKMLHARLLAYRDAQNYRLGVNHTQLPVNSPSRRKNYQRDGRATIDSQGGAPVYYPNSFKGPVESFTARKLQPKLYVSGEVKRYDTGEDDNYSQARDFYLNILDTDEKKRLTDNIIGDLRKAYGPIQDRVVQVFANVDPSLASNIARGLKQKPEAEL